MSEEKKFYVYVHKYASGPKEGQVFYVGKGEGRRLRKKAGRNRYWGRVVNKYGFTYEVLTRFHNEKCAFSFERALISFYGRENLVNMTDGGEGTCGAKRTKETKIKLSKANFRDTHYMRGRKLTEEQKRKISIGMTGVKRGPLSDSHKEKISKGKKSARNGKFKKDIFLFCHKDGRCIIATQNYMMNEIGLDRGNLSRLVNGKIKTSKGWYVYDE